MSRILLIDDDEDMLAMTGRWLEKAGYEATKASSGSDALKLVCSARFDLILLDYAMPVMDGPAVLEAIRSNDGYQDIPVLYRTGMEDTDIDLSHGVNGVIPKSEGKPGLMKAISAILG